MKWKRSKKAQQESKVSREESASEKRQVALNSTSSQNPKPSSSISSAATETQPINPDSQATSNVRRSQESESLYRPYVV